MSHFAKVEDGVVTEIIVAEQDVIDSGLFGNATSWVQTSYNTHGGKHPEGRPLRKNYAGIGHIYDKQRDAFYAPKPFYSWILNEETCQWEAPIPMPDDYKNEDGIQIKFYFWTEEEQKWKEQPLFN